MTESEKSSFVYVTFIRTTTELLWSALTSPECPSGDFMKDCNTGDVVELEPGKRLAIRWRNEFMPELKAEGWSLCTMELEPVGAAGKLTVTHSMERAGSKFIGAVSSGWPQILSNLKSLLETGSVILPRKYAKPSAA